MHAPLHALTTHPDISPGDRLGATVVFAVLAHLIVILGVTFVHEDRPERRITTLDVVLVPPSFETPPERADFLAQANRDGDGNDIERVRPETSPPPPVAAVPEMTVAGASVHGQPATPVEPAREADRMPASHPVGIPASPSSPGVAPPAAPATDPVLSTSRGREIAALSAEIERKLRAYAERPRRKWISARTREHAFAAYMDAWRRKVERVGNLNYPGEAARQGLSGSLLLEVALNPDGTVEDIALRRSSGRPVLDDAAVGIVRLAAPFARFPESIANEVDVLHIQRTWIFHSDNRISSP